MPGVGGDDFDWQPGETVCIREQPAIACYLNNFGEIVIRQKNWPGDDSYVLISPPNIPTLIKAIADSAGVNITVGTPAQLQSKPRDVSTGAERQRRYRDRHAVTPIVTPDVTKSNAAVTLCDAEAPEPSLFRAAAE